VAATWFLVGGLTLPGIESQSDQRLAGLPPSWTERILRGTEKTAPLWYRRCFVDRLAKASPAQEIGLHGGLTHLIWTDAQTTRPIADWELTQGLRALKQSSIEPFSFSFGREQETFHDLLSSSGIRCFRGRTPVMACRLGPTFPGAVLRAFDEWRSAEPPPIWPYEFLPGLWNLPSSLFLYPIGLPRTRVLPARKRIERFARGVDAAARFKGIFHFCLHPENLSESQCGFAIFEDMLDRLNRRRQSGDVEVLTMRQAVTSAESLLGSQRDRKTSKTVA
jgi:hypothetical protein